MVIFVKSYPKDFVRLQVLLESIEMYNMDNIPVYVCVDKGQPAKRLESTIDTSQCNVVYSEDILGHYTDKEIMVLQNMTRWEIQQVIKFEFCKNLIDSHNFLIVDSDSIFIRPFYISDFFDIEQNLYTIMRTVKGQIQDYANDVRHLDIGQDDQTQIMSFERKKIQKVFKREGKVYDFGPPGVLWSQLVINDFYDNYLLKNDLSFSDIIKEVPIEYNWYGEWLLESKVIPLIPKEPIFKNIFWEDQYDTLIKNGVSKSDLAETYIGLNLQTSFSREKGIIDYEL